MNEDIWNNLGKLKEMKVKNDQEEYEKRIEAEQEKEKKIMQEREEFLKEEDERKALKEKNLQGMIVKTFFYYVEYVFNGKSFFFCHEGFERFKKEIDKKNYIISIYKDKYLYRDYIDTEKNIRKFLLTIKDDQNLSNQEISIYGRSIHKLIKIDEAEELSKKIRCPIEDIHVHHMDEEPTNNRLSNLEVLHKDEHAKKHGFDTWEELQEDRKKSRLGVGID